MSSRSKHKQKRKILQPAVRRAMGANVCDHYLIILDILGQRATLDTMHGLSYTEADAPEMLEIVRQTGQLIKDFRTHFTNMVAPLHTAPPPPPETTAENVKIWNDLHKLNIEFMSFSDLVCVFGAMEPDNRSAFRVHRIMSLYYAMLATGAIFLLYMAEAGHAMRGGIAVSKAWTIFETFGPRGQLQGREIYGPALMYASDCEKCASWPRIVIHPSVIKYLDMVKRLPRAPLDFRLNEWADRTLDLIENDGAVNYLHYLGGEFKDAHVTDHLFLARLSTMIAKAYRFALNERNRFSQQADAKPAELYLKYDNLVKYFQSNRSLWPDEIK